MRKLNPGVPSDSSLNESMNEEYLCAKLHLVDLAGSERAKRTGSDGLRFKEGRWQYMTCCINMSFLVVTKSYEHFQLLNRCSH
jgi:hypothetical protein